MEVPLARKAPAFITLSQAATSAPLPLARLITGWATADTRSKAAKPALGATPASIVLVIGLLVPRA